MGFLPVHLSKVSGVATVGLMWAGSVVADENFTEEAVARGIDYVTSASTSFGRGVAFLDLDNDRDPDVVVIGSDDDVVGIFENLGDGTFVDRSATSGLGSLTKCQGVSGADYDNDGDLDVYIARLNEPNALLRNDGGFTFTDVAPAALVAHAGAAHGCAWGDIDSDGWIDLYVANHHLQNNVLFRNNGDGTFSDVTAEHAVGAGNDPTFQATFFDYDFDGDPDLYLATDKGAQCESNGWRNRLYEMVDGTYVDISAESDTDVCIDAMCIAVGDFDQNGWPDLFCTNTEQGSALLCNDGNGRFSRLDADAGVTDPNTVGWGGVFLDYNNDTLLDLYVCRQWFGNRMFKGAETWPVDDMAPMLGLDTPGISFCVAAADVDMDGDIDLLLQGKNEPIRLFINNTSGINHWVKLAIVGSGVDHLGIGTTIRLRTGSHWQQREVIAGSNFLSQNELIQQFGLGSASVVDEMIVMWPGGATRVFTNLPADTLWTVYPLDKRGDADSDGDRDVTDFLMFNACYTGESPETWSPGCEQMDYDGDADVDLADFLAFLAEYDDVVEDCNTNGIPDLQEILLGSAPDTDNDGLIDNCGTLPGDVDGDGTVGLADLLLVIGNWGTCAGCPAEPCSGDTNGDCTVSLADLLEVIGNWGTSL